MPYSVSARKIIVNGIAASTETTARRKIVNVVALLADKREDDLALLLRQEAAALQLLPKSPSGIPCHKLAEPQALRSPPALHHSTTIPQRSHAPPALRDLRQQALVLASLLLPLPSFCLKPKSHRTTSTATYNYTTSPTGASRVKT
jgi:hypothetical protein